MLLNSESIKSMVSFKKMGLGLQTLIQTLHYMKQTTEWPKSDIHGMQHDDNFVMKVSEVVH
jgi:hypothetical protein